MLPALLGAAFMLAVTGCQSVPDPAEIPTDMTVAELSQSAQNMLEANNYKAAEVYYQIMIDRNANDPAAVTAGEFEIAHIRMMKKKWSDAKPRLEAIIARFESTGGAGLPPEYLVLAKNDLARIPTKKTGVQQ